MTIQDRIAKAAEGFFCGEHLTGYGHWWLTRVAAFSLDAGYEPNQEIEDDAWERLCGLASDEEATHAHR